MSRVTVSRIAEFLFSLLQLVVIGFLLIPLVTVIGSSLGASRTLTFPPDGVSFKWYANLLGRPELFAPPLIFSAILAAVASLITTVAGTMAAMALTRHSFKGRNLVNAVILSPLILPAVITGAGLLSFFSTIGLMSTFTRLVLAHALIGLPFVVRTIAATLVRFDRSLEEAALNLGATPFQAFTQVTLPIIRPGLLAGSFFAFAISFDEFTVTIFLTDPRTTTLPIAIYHYIRLGLDPTISALATAILAFVVLGLLAIHQTVGLDRFTGLQH